uniref:Uncharacterized protein n=1 Tax=Musca domestica TaxID=7370 RepID=A0A1I8N5G2_MUSDO
MDDVVKLEYLVCGEILAPISVNAKEQFFLKCLECDEYFTMLEEFIMHYQYCHNDKFKMTMHSPDTSNAQYQREVDIQYADECQEDRDIHEENDVEEVKDENEENYEAEYALVNESQDNIDEDFGEEEVHNFKDSEGEDGSGDDDNEIGDNEIDDNEVDEDAEIEMYDEENDKADDDDELLQDADDSQEEYDDEGSQDFDRIETSNNDDEDPLAHTHKEEIKKARAFVSKFLECDDNWKAFMRAYEKVPQLWDPKLFPKKLNNDERNAYLQKIANEIKSERNIELDTNLVGLTTVRVRQHFRIRINRFKTAEDRHDAIENKIVPKWYFEAYAFLELTLEQLSIVNFDSQRKHLRKEQILQIIQIYQRFPNLWNTNLAENVCFNKRQEALGEMSQVIRREMGLTIKETSLRKYLQSLHVHFAKEKSLLLDNQDKKPESELLYYDHMKYLNDHVGPLMCEFCGRKHKSPLFLKVHIYESHHRDDPLRCPICSKEYEHVQPYVAHARRHMDDLQDECKECGKRFIRLADLRTHMRTHTGVRPFFCDVCGASFTKRYSLTEHSRRHEKVYKFFCDICSKGFYERAKMNRHKICHSDIRKYCCSICGKAFKTRRHTKIHESTHADSREFPCPLCGKLFKNKIGVTHHLRTHRKNMETVLSPFTMDPLEKTLQGTNSNNDVCHAEKSIEKTFSDCGDELMGEHSKSFVKEFLKCDLNYKAILFAYQNQPSLWNRNLFPNKLNNDERNLCLKNIALELKTARNIELDTSMVTRHTYCVKLRRYKTIEQRKAAERNKIVPGWYFKQLAFLQPMMDHFTITKLDSQRTNLTKEQIIQILEIYKNFPVLWNTSLVENVCSNKRQEALERMLKPIHKEMGLKINVSILQQYLDSIHAHLSKEKTMLLKNNKNNENISMYYDHMKFLHDHVGPFCCGICGRRNRSPLHLKVHIYQKHNRNDPLRCPMCNKIYQQMEPYVAHARRHMNDLRVECKECGMFIRHADLRVHMYTHTGIKSYCCEVCGSVFTTASALVDHKRRHEKLYKVFCEICSKGFYYDEKLREHMTTHTNIRNYACGICGKKFKAKKTLKAHKSTHEEGLMEEYIEYILCGEILVAPAIDSKDQYCLKCNECSEYYSTLDEFIAHHQSDHSVDDLENISSSPASEVECNEEYLEIYSPLSVKAEHSNDGCEVAPPLSPTSYSETQTHDKNMDDGSTKSEIDDEEGFKGFESEGMAGDDETDPLDQPQCERTEDPINDEDNDNACFESEAEWEPEDNKTKVFVSQFLKCEKNFLTFIEAYKKQPRLWNWKQYPSKLNSSKEREKYWSQIAAEIRNNLNIEITCKYVSAVIRRIRNGYAIKLNRLKSYEQRGGTLKSRNIPQWYFNKMQFLEPFLNNYSIVEIGVQRQPLETEEIIQILEIYKRFPHLWNTNLVENVCTNKRDEALSQMIEALQSELSLQVDDVALKKYLYCIHGHFTTEKAKMLHKKTSPKDISIYYEHMLFLDEHVGPFYCSECGKKHKNPLQLKVHESLSHGLEPLKCPLCVKTYTNVQAYTFHARRHMNDTSEVCRVCGKTFIKVVDLTAHMRGHNGIKPYFCEICGSSFTMPSSLTEHKKRHSAQNKEHCSICSKAFFSKRRLNMHLLTHSNSRSFVCNICGKAFKTKKTMRAHETIHEDSRNHPCTLCGKMFKNRIGVTQHLRTHRNNADTASNPFIGS